MRKFPLTQQQKYMRIPFKEHGRDFDGCDCGGLVWLVYKQELGIELPDWRRYYQNTHIESFTDLSATIGTMLGNICYEIGRNTRPQPFDVISLTIAGHPIHVGIMINENYFMHIMEGYSNVRQERLNSINWSKRIEGIYRHSGLA